MCSRRNTAPTITEIKAHLDTPELKETFKQVVGQFKDIDKRFNSDELYDNTEKFIKEKSVYYTMLDVADDCQSGNIDTANILDRFEKACSVNLTGGIGLEFFSGTCKMQQHKGLGLKMVNGFTPRKLEMGSMK